MESQGSGFGSADNLPFKGIRVVDFGWIYAVPHATGWLGSLGADVIRIESRAAPDLVRYIGATDGIPGLDRSGGFNAINFAKRSVSINLTRPEGAAIARRLIALSDIVTENYTVGNMKKFGLSYEELRQIKPDLIMLSGTPLGQTGPLATSVGFGPTTQAFAGVCHLSGYHDGYACGIGGTWPDFIVGTMMVFLLLSALHYRNRTGRGQYIDLSMAQVVTSMLPEAMIDFFMNSHNRGPTGNRDYTMAPHGVFPTLGEDQWIAIAVTSDVEFGRLCQTLGAPALAADPRFVRMEERLRNVEVLESEIAGRTLTFERDQLVEQLRAAGLAAGPVYNTKELMEDAAFRSSGMLGKINHPVCGERLIPGIPVKFSALEPDYGTPPPIGSHCEEVLTTLLGYSLDEVARLREEKILF